MEVTADLHNWQYVEPCYYGYVHNDAKERWTDNTFIRTSKVERVEGDLVITLNSVYRLVGSERGSDV